VSRSFWLILTVLGVLLIMLSFAWASFSGEIFSFVRWPGIACVALGIGFLIHSIVAHRTTQRGFEVKPITDTESVPEMKENDHG
jgi:hypothetical protein